jgi:hypothetical protein
LEKQRSGTRAARGLTLGATKTNIRQLGNVAKRQPEAVIASAAKQTPRPKDWSRKKKDNTPVLLMPEYQFPEIIPIWVDRFNQFNLGGTAPRFDSFLLLNGL